MLKVEEAMAKWFSEVTHQLKAYGPAQTAVDEVIMASVSVIENYLTSGCMLAENKRVLPAKTLLRPIGEFTAKLRYCLAGETKEEIYARVERWRKSSWMDCKKHYEAVRDACQGSDCGQIQQWISHADSVLAGLTAARGFPQVRQILETVFSSDPVIPPGIYGQHLIATHIDVVTLAQTVAEESQTKEFMGDLPEDSTQIERDLLSQAYLYIETISKHYSWDCGKMLSEYKKLTQTDEGKS
ncbi:MAG: hypothetical protein JW741_25920 [Sedimentisphaerales bacterium]|nr:hypothetical protein [Sedimentisphaerales bacterium]